jgi:hypothetical protein
MAQGRILFAVFYLSFFLQADAAGTKVLEYNFGRPLQTMPAVDLDGTIYVAGKGAVAALSSTGVEEWKIELSPGSQADIGGVTVGENRIYVTSAQGLYAFNKSGTQLWTNGLSITNSKVALFGQTNLYVISTAGVLWALRDDASVRWTNSVEPMEIPPSDVGPVVAPNGTIYSSWGSVVAFSYNGAKKWKIESFSPYPAPIINEEGSIFTWQASFGGNVLRYDSSGTQTWVSAYMQGRPAAPAVIGPDDTLYAPMAMGSFGEGGLTAFRSNGEKAWDVQTPVYASPAVAADGTIYMAAQTGFGVPHLIIARSGSGVSLWSYTNGAPVVKGIALGTDGTVLLAHGNGVLLGLSGSAPAAGGVWPVYGRDPQQTSQQRVSPVLTILPVEQIATNSAMFRAELNPAGQTGAVFFEYSDGISTMRTVSEPFSATNVPVQIAETVTNLSEGTIYSVQLVISNSFGVARSENVAFQTLGVPETVPPTLGNIEAAATLGGTIKFSGSGVINFTVPVTFLTNATLDANGHQIVLNGNGLSSLLRVSNSVSLTLKGLTLINGKALEVSTATNITARGGALVNDGGSLTLEECVLSNNVASVTRPDQLTPAEAAGGAIWQTSGSLSIQNCVFTNNQALGLPWVDSMHSLAAYSVGRGGAIGVAAGDVEVVESTFGGNVVSGLPGDGGAIYFTGGDLQISGSGFYGNSAGVEPRGGALCIASGNLSVSHSILSENVAVAGAPSDRVGTSGVSLGGAIYNAANAILGSTSFLSNRTVGGASSRFLTGPSPASSVGGAVFSAGTLVAFNNTFSGDQAVAPFYDTRGRLALSDGYASAIYSAGNAAITNSTFQLGALGLYMVRGENNTNLTVKNSLFDYSRVGPGYGSIVGFIDAGNNLSSDAPPFTEPTSNTNLNLRLGPVGFYGGTTPVIPLLAGSPAIDAADVAAAPATDQRGRIRPYGAHADVGAFESSAPFYVWGRINGYIDPTTTLTIGTNTIGTANGEFFLGPIPSGTNEVDLAAQNALFSPDPWMIDVTVDGEIPGPMSFEPHTLTYYGSLESPQFVLAGLPGETWKVEMTQDFEAWTDVGTYTIGASGLVTVPVPAETSLYLRTTAQE